LVRKKGGGEGTVLSVSTHHDRVPIKGGKKGAIAIQAKKSGKKREREEIIGLRCRHRSPGRLHAWGGENQPHALVHGEKKGKKGRGGGGGWVLGGGGGVGGLGGSHKSKGTLLFSSLQSPIFSLKKKEGGRHRPVTQLKRGGRQGKRKKRKGTDFLILSVPIIFSNVQLPSRRGAGLTLTVLPGGNGEKREGEWLPLFLLLYTLLNHAGFMQKEEKKKSAAHSSGRRFYQERGRGKKKREGSKSLNLSYFKTGLQKKERGSY